MKRFIKWLLRMETGSVWVVKLEGRYLWGTMDMNRAWATQDKKFNEEGFVSFSETGFIPIYGDVDSWLAVERFFDINYEQSDFLFSRDADKRGNLQDVITRLKAFIRSGGNVKYVA